MGKPRQKTFKRDGIKMIFKISANDKFLLIQSKSKNGNVTRTISKSQARRLADWLEWWTK